MAGRLLNRVAHLEAQQATPVTADTLIGALAPELREQVKNPEDLAGAARLAPAGLLGDLPALALWSFLCCEEVP